MTRQYRGTCGCGWDGEWSDSYLAAAGSVRVHHERDACTHLGGVAGRPTLDEHDTTETQPILSEGTRRDLATQTDGRDVLPDGGTSVVSVDGVESPVPRRYADSVGRLPGAEVLEE